MSGPEQTKIIDAALYDLSMIVCLLRAVANGLTDGAPETDWLAGLLANAEERASDALQRRQPRAEEG